LEKRSLNSDISAAQLGIGGGLQKRAVKDSSVKGDKVNE
jgi:hypothetical protein